MKLAESEYNLNCAERVRGKVRAMSADEAKQYKFLERCLKTRIDKPAVRIGT